MRLKNINKVWFKALPIFLAAMISLMTVFAVPSVKAVSYGGKGTKSDPYLVETPEQLQGMKDNLLAHYKLANTIDLSDFGVFTPIGNLANPFMGSFTCDINSDGTPKYAIKNLKVYNDAGERFGHKGGTNIGYVDYKEKKSNWEAALFGAAKGATFENIAILDADITNTVVGQNQMNNDWSLNPGQDEQATATLAAFGDGITVKNCSASGKINSKSNHCGGLLGKINSSTIKNSYSAVTVTTQGLWCHGGFFASGLDNTITNCFASGDLKTDKARVGGFVGSGGGTMENCYSTGAIIKGRSFFASENKISLTNCVSLSISATVITDTLESTVNNCLVVEGGSQTEFTTASASKIKTVIESINKNIKIIKDTAKYVPGTVNSNISNSQNEGDAQQTTSGNAAQNTEEPVVMTAEELTALTNELAEKAVMKQLTLEDAIKGIKIKEYYAAMDRAEMDKVSKATVANFESIYNESSKTILAGITEKVESLPDIADISGENAAEVIQLWEMYDALPKMVKDFFEQDIVDKLNKAYEAAQNMANVQVVTKQVEAEFNQLQTVLIIVLVGMNVIAFCGFVILGFFCVKTLRKISFASCDGEKGAMDEDEENDE